MVKIPPFVKREASFTMIVLPLLGHVTFLTLHERRAMRDDG